ncbi:hypothetical protein E1A91_A05G296600v1 [Gossypium mustelinum]|uniref:Uncharacterized protein n=1 Tax=Gossypium mustelinum TaxID=34275 RepID=A0A5D2ZF64_GOSMU|nr:hypothetical protein E1A91_A05G296600v1 [Gossypium mustelinum]
MNLNAFSLARISNLSIMKIPKYFQTYGASDPTHGLKDEHHTITRDIENTEI